jgi:hypothetical protein
MSNQFKKERNRCKSVSKLCNKRDKSDSRSSLKDVRITSQLSSQNLSKSKRSLIKCWLNKNLRNRS